MKNRSRRSGPSVPRTTPVIVTGTMSAIPASPFPPPWRQASRVIRGQRSLVPRTAKGPRTAKRPADRALRLAADADDRVVVFRARAVRGPSGGGDEAGRREGQAVEEGADLLRAAQVVGARRVLVVDRDGLVQRGAGVRAVAQRQVAAGRQGVQVPAQQRVRLVGVG